jgi:Uncharacterized protein conserved in bacteria
MAIIGALSTPATVTTSSKMSSCQTMGNSDNAIDCYTNLIKKEPYTIEYYNGRANVYLNMGKLDEALADANKSVSLNKHDMAAYHIRAKVYERKAMYNEAIADYTKYIDGNKKTPDYLGLWGRGKCYGYLKQSNKAIQDMSQAIKLRPDDVNLYNWRGDYYYYENDYANAVKDYELYTQKSEAAFNGLFQLGACYVKLGNNDKAMHIYQQLSDLDPGIEKYFSGPHALDVFNLDLRRKLAQQYLDDANINIGEAATITSKSMLDIKLNDAFEKLQLAWAFLPNSTSINNERGLADSIGAKIYLVYPQLKTKPVVPEYVRKFTVQATSFVDDKNYTKAVQLYQRALSTTPYYPLAHFNIAMLYAAMKDFPNAIHYMKNYLKLAPDAPDARAAQDKIYEWEVKPKN